MNEFDLHLIAGPIRNLRVGTLRDHVVEKAKGLPVNPDDSSDGYEFDSERFDHFACYIGENFVSGMFRSVRFKDGDEVSAVIKKKPGEDDLCVALLHKETNQLHLRMMMEAGAWARFLQPVKFLSILSLAGSVLMLIIIMLAAENIGEFIFSSLMMIPVFLFLVLILALWDYYLGGGKIQGESASTVFKLLGFKDPLRLNLGKYSLLHRHGDPLGECVYEVEGLLNKT